MKGVSCMHIKKRNDFPMITIIVIVITAFVTLLQFIYPDILTLFRRDPVSLKSGEWWRILTPLLVHSEGWGQIIFNMIGILIIGIKVEQLYGKAYFLILYLTGGLIGEFAGYM